MGITSFPFKVNANTGSKHQGVIAASSLNLHSIGKVKRIIAAREKLGSHRIQRAYCDGDIFCHYVGVDFAGLDVGVSHELLEHSDIDSVFKHVGGE